MSAGDDEREHQAGGGEREGPAARRMAAPFDERSRQEEQRQGDHRPDRRPRAAAPPRTRFGDSARGDLRLDEQTAAARGNREGVGAAARRGIAVPRSHRDRHERRGHDERVGEHERALDGSEHLLDDDGARARRLRAVRVENRLDADKPRAQGAGRHKQRRRSVDALLGDLGHPSGPREWRIGRVVDGQPGAPRFCLGERGVHGCEQAARGRRIARRRKDGVAVGFDARGNRAERVGAGVEALPQLGFHPGQRGLIRAAETRPLVRPSRETDGKRGDQTGAQDARDENHCSLRTAYNQ